MKKLVLIVIIVIFSSRGMDCFKCGTCICKRTGSHDITIDDSIRYIRSRYIITKKLSIVCRSDYER